MNKEKSGSKDRPLKCETTVSCKATASLEVSAAADLDKEDKNLQELLDDNDKTSPVCD
jgi:hypothetical protein